MSVLVTGGTGLVGSAISEVVKNDKNASRYQWFFINSSSADLRDPKQCEEIFKKIQPTIVIHLAAVVGGLFENMQNNLKFLTDNVKINSNVLECCHNYKVKKVISCLSTCVFPDKTTYPIDETMIHNGPPHSSNYGYSYAKRLIDTYNRAYHDRHNCMFTSIIPTNIFGKHDNFNLQRSHVIPGLIHKMYKLLEGRGNEPEENLVFTVAGTGKPLRQFIYSLDLAKLIVWVLENYESVEPIILSPGEEDEVSIETVAREIAKAFHFKGKIGFDSSQADGQFKKTASNAKLRTLYPDFEFTLFSKAISETVEWFKANYKNARI